MFEILVECKSLNNDFLLNLLKYKINKPIPTTFKFFLEHNVKRKEVFGWFLDVEGHYNYKFVEKLGPTVMGVLEGEALMQLIKEDLAQLNQDRSNIHSMAKRMECLHVLYQFPGLSLIEILEKELYQDQNVLNDYIANFIPSRHDPRHQALLQASQSLVAKPELNADFKALLTKIVYLK